jgi:alpha-L-fucosidase 2
MASNNYTGENSCSAISSALPSIRDWIFTNGTGNMTELQGSNDLYGSYRVLGNLSAIIPSIHAGNNSISGYIRTLDISNGIHTTNFSPGSNDFETSTFCSFPDQVCVYTVQSSRQPPTLEVSLYNRIVMKSSKTLLVALGMSGCEV